LVSRLKRLTDPKVSREVSLVKRLTLDMLECMQLTSLADWNCSIARTLDVVGEWWTLLILRDAFRGTRRFDDFKDSLGLARSVLTARLRKLTDEGILERRSYSDRPPRYEYLLTEKGRE